MGQKPAGVAPIAPAGMRADLAFEPQVDDAGIAGRYHNPPYAVLAVITFITQVRRNSKQNLLRLPVARDGCESGIGGHTFSPRILLREWWFC
jgi:hypothetical protein